MPDRAHTSWSFELPSAPTRQPSPAMNKGGDCGPCCIAGVAGISVQRVYDAAGKIDDLSFFSLPKVIEKLGLASLPPMTVQDWPREPRPCQQVFGAPAHMFSMEWFDEAEKRLRAGYYGFAAVDSRKRKGFESDHWVLIRGARETFPERVGRIVREILIGCSAGVCAGWIEVNDFLREMGGFNAHWGKLREDRKTGDLEVDAAGLEARATLGNENA